MDAFDDFVLTMIRLTAYIAPFFLIPATFKWGLGVFGNLAGIINDRSRGLFDRQKKARAERKAEGWQRFKTGTGKGRIRRTGAFRGVGTSLGAGWEGRYGFGERGAQARAQIAELAASEQVMKNPRWSTIQENDDALRAATYGSQGEAIQALTRRWDDEDRAKRAAAAAGASIGYGRSQAIAAAKQMSTTGTGYTDLVDEAETIARASGGDTNIIGAVAGYNNFINKQKGNFHLSPGAGSLISLATREAQGGFATEEERVGAYRTATRQSWGAADIQTAVRGKGPEIAQYTSHFREIMGDPNATAVHKRDAAIALAELHAALPGATAENQRYINDTMQQLGIQHGVNPATGTPYGTVEDQLSTLLAAGPNPVAMSGEEINGVARKYGSTIPYGQRGGVPEE